MKVFVVAGARPNFMKIAPLLAALDKYRGLEVLLVHTGQHYDAAMSGSFFEELGIREPHINLQVGSASHAVQTARIMTAFEPVCLEHRPDWVVVVGDVNSTVACALTASKLGIGVAHVEAGLRSRDRSMPEEINRVCTDAIADLLFTTERDADDNLRAEGVPAEKIHFVGNTMIDTLIRQKSRALATPLPDGLQPKGYAVLTLHRPANVDDAATIEALLDAVGAVAQRMPVVFPVHPRTRANLERFGVMAKLAAQPNWRFVDPQPYVPFLGLVARARMVLTDSGGIQEETTYLGIPCVTMRDNTERPVTCTEGTNLLAGTNPEAIRAAALEILDRPPRRHSIPEKWDGCAAERIAEVLTGSVSRAGRSER